jgi:hypothetical protein
MVQLRGDSDSDTKVASLVFTFIDLVFSKLADLLRNSKSLIVLFQPLYALFNFATQHANDPEGAHYEMASLLLEYFGFKKLDEFVLSFLNYSFLRQQILKVARSKSGSSSYYSSSSNYYRSSDVYYFVDYSILLRLLDLVLEHNNAASTTFDLLTSPMQLDNKYLKATKKDKAYNSYGFDSDEEEQSDNEADTMDEDGSVEREKNTQEVTSLSTIVEYYTQFFNDSIANKFSSAHTTLIFFLTKWSFTSDRMFQVLHQYLISHLFRNKVDTNVPPYFKFLQTLVQDERMNDEKRGILFDLLADGLQACINYHLFVVNFCYGFYKLFKHSEANVAFVRSSSAIRSKYDILFTWCEAKVADRLGPEQKQVSKTSSSYTSSSSYYRNSKPTILPYKPPIASIYAYLQQIFLRPERPQEDVFVYDEDDDDEVLIGRRVWIRWSENKYYIGAIIGYNPKTKKHHIRYDDGDERDYAMNKKTWQFEGEELPKGARKG